MTQTLHDAVTTPKKPEGLYVTLDEILSPNHDVTITVARENAQFLSKPESPPSALVRILILLGLHGGRKMYKYR